MEQTFFADVDLRGHRLQGEWFAVSAGPADHVIFITNLLAAFYVERYRDPAIWGTRLQWVISPDDSRLSEIPQSDETYLCAVEDGSARLYDEEWRNELGLRVKAEEQAEALGRIIYPELDE